MSRKIYASGRSVSRINSETVSASVMRKVASLLIDIHGQHEHGIPVGQAESYEISG